MRACWRRAAAALGGFLRGFLGLEATGSEGRSASRIAARASARRALERRAAARRPCC
jgi:hypothetical protein